MKRIVSVKEETALVIILMFLTTFPHPVDLPVVSNGDNAIPQEPVCGQEPKNLRGVPSLEPASSEQDKSKPTEVEEHLMVAGEVRGEWIVRFKEYRPASEHRRTLEGALDNAGQWQWVERKNPASIFPTDFTLLTINLSYQHQIKRQLEALSFVKDVSPQMRFTRAPLEETHTPTGKCEENEKGDFFRKRSREGYPSVAVEKPHGRMRTKILQDEKEHLLRNVTLLDHPRHLLLQRSQITSMFGAEKLWARGFSGGKVKMAVFDTGVRADHPHFRNVKERTNWTNENTLNDNLGHGTFVAGVISSQDSQCLGFAPDAEIYAFRVFTDAQVSYTSWFLDAFNYAIATKMNILNLSIGGPDYLDRPFVEKVWEMTANNIIMVSAIGNDGPLYGTLNNPADQNDVIGVGGIDYNDHIASFSSRGMSTWEIPHGYGRVKPDVVAYGREVRGSKITTGCKGLSGTSVASPVVAGAVCLLASVIPEQVRWEVLNPASMKQALVEGAIRLSGPNMYEQGAGRLDLLQSFQILVNYHPRASIFPNMLDFTDCPYAWPFCRQPIYADAMPVMFNATILNGMGVVGYIESPPIWVPSKASKDFLNIHFTYSDVIWPWTGYLGLHFQVKPEGRKFAGIIEGNVTFTVVSPPARGETHSRVSECVLPVKVAIVPTPPREMRILWDQFHSIRYPPGYIPRDSLDVRNDILDWHGDHLHTNFHTMFDVVRDSGYFVESLGSPLTCFNAKNYGTLLMVDLEDEFYDEEIQKVKDDVENHGLGLIVFADWYHVETMIKMKFFDDNTRSWWTPATGGANIPALNDLLAPFGIAFGDTILNGVFSIGGERAHYASGSDIIKFPAGGFLHKFLFRDNSALGLSTSRSSIRAQVELPILGAVKVGSGRVAVYGDSNCLDSSHMVTNCYWLLKKLLEFTSKNTSDPLIFSSTNELATPLGGPETVLPARRTDVNFSLYSLVLKQELLCGNDAPVEVQGSQGFSLRNLKLKTSESLSQSFSLISMNNPPMQNVAVKEINLSTKMSTFQNENQSMQDMGSRKSESNGPFFSFGTTRQNYDEISNVSKITNKMRHDYVRPPMTRAHSSEQKKNGSDGRGKQKESRLTFVWRTRDELDSTTSVAVQWLIPLLLFITGVFVILSLWRATQRKRRRTKKGLTRLFII